MNASELAPELSADLATGPALSCGGGGVGEVEQFASALAASAIEPARLIDQIVASGDSTSRSAAQRLNVNPEDVKRGLGQLVLTLVKLIHEVMERQAIRRMDSGTLSDEQVERLGTTLMLQSEEIRSLCEHFGIQEKDLNLDLGPLGRLV